MKQLIYFMALVALWGTMACSSNEDSAAFVPVAPNYSDEAMWYQVKNDKGEGVDVFYVVSTWEFDWLTDDNIVSHYADVFNHEHREDMGTEIKKNACIRTSSSESKPIRNKPLKENVKAPKTKTNANIV